MKLLINKLLFGGKNGQLPYWVESFATYLMPVLMRQRRLRRALSRATQRPDYDEMMQRVRMYCPLDETRPLPPEAFPIGSYTISKDVRRSQIYYPGEALPKAYFFDSYRVIRWFPRHLRWLHHFGDVIDSKPYPTIVKTRPIACDSTNSILLKLDRNRHFTFVRDSIPTLDKQPRLLCRCSINIQPQRMMLFEKYFGQPWCDLGEVSTGQSAGNHPEWLGNKLTLYQHLNFRYIACFEGNDVASNLKWVMSSNSIAVMTRPRYESWFLESRLIPDYHYILVSDDLSDLPARLAYYNEHPDEEEAIVRHAHEYVAQFTDESREDLIQKMVMQRYFEMTGQL